MYIGKQLQQKTVVKNYTTGKKEKVPKEEQVLIEGDFEPIIDEEVFYEVQRIKEAKENHLDNSKFGGNGRKPQDKWVAKLECDCGSTFNRAKWGKNKQGTRYGYVCRNKKTNKTSKYLIEHGIDPSEHEHCDSKSFPEWHLELMARYLFAQIVGSDSDKIINTFELIEECYQPDEADNENLKKLTDTLGVYEKRLGNLTDRYMDDEIDKSLYERKKTEYSNEICRIKAEIQDIESELIYSQRNNIKQEEMYKLLNTMIQLFDMTKDVDPEFVMKYIDKIVVRDKTTYEWLINLRGDAIMFKATNTKITNTKREEKRDFTLEQIKNHYSEMFTFNINFDDAKEYRENRGEYIKLNLWQDKVIIVYIRY